jgi:hypothetical protein
VDQERVKPPLGAQVAIFSIIQSLGRQFDQRLTSAKSINDYKEVAVPLERAVTLLDYDEFTPRPPKPHGRVPNMRIVHRSDQDGSDVPGR